MPKARVDIEQKTHQAAPPQSVNRNAARSNVSAGILAYRRAKRGLEVLLVHPGGPFWRKKDDGAWSIPKGEIDAADDPEQVARREFAEELGPVLRLVHSGRLGEIRQRGGKRVIAFAGEGHFDPAALIQQYLRYRMAAPKRSTAELSRSRPRGMVRYRVRTDEDAVRSGRASRSSFGDRG